MNPPGPSPPNNDKRIPTLSRRGIHQDLTPGRISYIIGADHFMKTGLRKLFFGRKSRWLPLLLLAMGFGLQIAGKCLPTLVVCYKANEKPQIEFLYDMCACRQECANRSLAGLHERSMKFQSRCLDVPLISDQGYGPVPRLTFLQFSRCGPAREFFGEPLPHSLFPRTRELGAPPPRSERVDSGPGPVFQTGGVDSRLCRFIC